MEGSKNHIFTINYKSVIVDFHLDMYNFFCWSRIKKEKKIFFALYQGNIRSICTLT